MTAVARVRGRRTGSAVRKVGAGIGGVGLRVQVVVILGLLALILAATVGVLFRQAREHDAVVQARQAALAAARSDAGELLSYDYRTLKHDFATGKADATGQFRKQYAETTSKLVGPQAKKSKAVVKARVLNTAVVRAEPDQVVVLLYVDQTTQSTNAKTRIDQNRVRMTLDKVGDAWLVSKLEAL
ncbi:MAG: hypothetical protein ACRDN9_06410 [Streptosporangiaceae bacterium]